MAIAKKSSFRCLVLFITGIFLVIIIEPAIALPPELHESKQIHTLWLIVAGSLVFFMNAGFAMLESGLCQTRNSTNILAKNLIVFCITIFAFWLLGFGLMFGDGNTWIGQAGFFFRAFDLPSTNSIDLNFASLAVLYPQQPLMVAFFFQLVFAGTTATIVSGAMAERVKFWAFFWFSFLLIAIAYPLTGRWVWHPNGWLATINFLDFAGSTVVHSVGGMAGLVGTILIGPRRGWQGYNPDEIKANRYISRPKSFCYNNLSLSTLGCLILWLGWLGFNGGSAISIADVPHIIATTMLAGGSGGIFILFLRGLRHHKPTLSLVINGILGGLVSITASSAYVSLAVAILIGAVSSVWIILLEQLLEQLRIDDPVGAVPVHLGCGIWGTLAVGLFVNQLPPYINNPVIRFEQIMAQIIGILAVNLTTMVLSLIFWLTIGFCVCGLESFNRQLKRSQKNKLLSQGQVDCAETIDNTKLLQGEVSSSEIELISNSSTNRLAKYLNLARQSLRVSLTEEAQGSDGTFS